MTKTASYSFLQDTYALFEIRKHKWLISEKAGREIGFASAAIDWIKHYGDAWRFYRFSNLFQPDSHRETAQSGNRHSR